MPRIGRPAKTVPFVESLLSSPATDDCILWPFSLDQDGYPVMAVRGWERRATRAVCRLAYGECPPGKECRHLCNTPACVNPRHLRWSTPKENQADRVANGTHNRGERSYAAVLTSKDVLFIRECYARREHNQRELAEMFGVTQPHISDIINKKAWNHL